MLTVTSTEGVNSFHKLLERVERGETIRIVKHGRARARLVPDCDFMSGDEFRRVFKNYKATAADKAAADAIEETIREMDAEDEMAH